MSTLRLYALRVAAAASYLTLVAADTDLAGRLAGPYAIGVLLVFICDLWAAGRQR